MNPAATFYITTPIYYVNDVPHIGHAYTTVAADVLARYWRLRGRDVFFLTGLDEHGQKVQQAAAKAGVDPQLHCDRLAPQFKNLWQRLNISHDAFIRTTDPAHKSVVQQYLQRLYERELIYKTDYTGWYCTFDERFWTEKDVEDRLCPDCKRPVEHLSESNYFFKMGQYQDRLIDHINRHEAFIRPESRRNEVLGFLQTQKLGDLSISRPKSRLSWGIELPFDKNYVTYVWFDALINYLSALEYLAPANALARFWPADVHLIGKDILTTHAVYWSTMLMALELPLPATIFAHGWWTVDGEKMSKSRGNVVDPHAMVDEFGADAFRYVLLREVPFGQDGDFSRDTIVTRMNSALANGIGNLLSRTLTLIERSCGGVIPDSQTPVIPAIEERLERLSKTLPERIETGYEAFSFRDNLLLIEELVSWCDTYIDKSAPWKLAKEPAGHPQLRTVLHTSARALRLLSVLIYPFMPLAAQQILHQLGLSISLATCNSPGGLGWDAPLAGTTIRKGAPLFPRIEKTSQGVKTVDDNALPAASAPADVGMSTPSQTTGTAPSTVPAQITIDEFMKIQLKTATVLSAERVPKSEKLITLHVDLGGEQRQIVAGIGKKYEPASLIGRRIVIVANLKPAKLMGIESQGMVLAAGDKEVGGLVTVLEDVEPGTKVK